MRKNLLQALSNMHAEFGVAITDDSKGARSVSYASLLHTLDQLAKMTRPHGLQLEQDYEIYEGMPIIVSKLTHIASQEFKISRSILTPKQDTGSNADQGWGGSTTYHKRYGAMTVCGVFCHGDATDDDGQTAPQQQTAPNSNAISEKQLGLLVMKLKGKDDLRDSLVKHYGSLAQVPWKDFQEILRRIDANPESK